MGICSSKFSARVAPLTITPTEVTTPPLPTSNTQKESAGLHSEAGEDRTSLASKSVALKGGDSRLFSPQVIHINPSIPPNFFPSHRESAAEIQCRKTAAQLKPRKSEATIRDEVQQLIAQWEKSGELSVIENHVLSVSSSQTSSIQELSDALVAPYATYIEQLKGKQLHLEVAKAYAIYFWITTNIKYDRVAFQAYLSGEKPSKEEPSHVLIARKSMCCGYSNLFKALAVHIGMQATVIQGHTKSWQIFSDGQNAPFTPSRPNSHFWNAVMLGGVWFPIDCTFGSGAVTSGNAEFTSEATRHYFAVPPERLILTHWPLEETWQLLESPITLQEMQPLIPVHAQVFASGVQPKNWSECIHSSDSPVVRVELKAEPDVIFTAKLTEYDAALKGVQKPDLSAPGIEQATYLEGSKDKVAVNATFPHSGYFTLNIYMKEPVSEGQHDAGYQLCLSYQVRCEFSHQSQVGYPLVFDAASSAFGFQLLHWNLPHKSYICENETGKLEVVFRANPDLHFYHCLLPGKIKDLDSSSADQYHTMVACDSEDPSLFTLQIVLPEVGWWTVNLCASKADVDLTCTGTVGYTAVLNYHVLAKRALQKHSYPLPLSHNVTFESCTPICANGREPLTLPFISPKALDFVCYITHVHPQGERVDQCTKVINLDSPDGAGTSNYRYALKVTLPKPGKWYVHVFAVEESSQEATAYFGLFNLCLETDSGMMNTIFPYLDTSLAKELSIDINTSDALQFLDDGTPFEMQFLAPADLRAQHDIESLSATQNSASADTSQQHYTALQRTSSRNISSCNYTLAAVFPSAGRWSVRLFASLASDADQYRLVVRADVEVSNPTPDVAYLKLHPAFHQLSLSVPDNHLQYKVVRDSPEYKLPFNAPDNLHFAWTMKHLPSGEDLRQQAFVHYSIAEKSQCDHRLDLILSRPGEWQLCLFAKPINTQAGFQTEVDENESYSSILDFKIQSKEVTTDRAFPQIFEPFSSFGMRLKSPSALPLPSIVNQIPVLVTVPFYSPPQVKFWHCAEVAELLDSVHDTRMISNSDTRMHELSVEISEQGHWTVTLYAQHINSASKNWVAVLQHTIFADI